MTPALAVVAILVSAALLFAFAIRTFGNSWYGLLTAGLFLSTPLLWVQLNPSPVSLLPLPFVTLWLLAVAQLQLARGLKWRVLAGVALGAGVYSTPAAMVMMPLFLMVTIVVFARSLPLRQLALIAAAFAVVTAPAALSLLLQPGDFRGIVSTLRLYDATRFNVLQGLREMASWVGLTARVEVYYNYFNPAFLFLTGGVLLVPMMALIPIGLYRLLDEATPVGRVVLAGFLAAPITAALTADPPIPRRILYLTPFAPVVSAYGVQLLASWLRTSLAHRASQPRKPADDHEHGERPGR
jgi:hypothetical protein